MKNVILVIIVVMFNLTISVQAQQLKSLSFEEKIHLNPSKISTSEAPTLDTIYMDNNVVGYIIEKKSGNTWIFLSADGQRDGTEILNYDLILDSLKANLYRIITFYLDGRKEISFFRAQDYAIALK
jgi:hypothetical protein